MTDPDLREPDLPRTMKVRQRALRRGFSTGANAAAATKAALLALTTGQLPEAVEIPFPSGDRYGFIVHSGATDGATATAVVVKDAGDDPDVTHGAHLTATVTRCAGDEVIIVGGDGVGTVTKPGLGLEVGGSAINPVPRRMITEAAREVVASGGVHVTISVPDGEKMARKTTNRRLGIVGGISILGTTGIVRPFSTASWRASVEQAVAVMAAQGIPTLVLATGGRTERGAMALLPNLPEVAFVEVGDFTGAALRRAVEHDLADVVFVGMVGKLTKLASGVLMTHYTRSKVDTGLLARITRDAGGSTELVTAVEAANTARHAYELWAEAGLLRPCGDAVCAAVRDVLQRFSGEAGRVLPARVAMVDFTGTRVVAATEPHWVAP
jgi:cobalt-precorrin-5B (C1)-methyltransferase